jgi:hypothetical protein
MVSSMLVPEKITVLSEEPPKAASPMDVTLAGIVMEVRDESLNALSAIDTTVVGIEEYSVAVFPRGNWMSDV